MDSPRTHSPLSNRLPDRVDIEFCKTNLSDVWDKGISEAFKNLEHDENGTISKASYLELSKVDPWRVSNK